MEYVAVRIVDARPEEIWRVLADLRHFAADDPYHHDLEFVDERREGVGASFRVRHTYAPIFPFPAEPVVCTVTAWEPESRLAIFERARRRFRDHSQEFRLEPVEGGRCRLTYRIGYLGVPWLLLPWRLWVDSRVRRRMAQKLGEVAAAVRPGAASG